MSHPTDPENNPSVAHEHSDADSHAITRFGIALAFILVVSQLVMWWVFDRLSARETKLSPHVSAIIKAQAPTLPPEPRLQGNAPLDLHPRLDLQKMRREEDDALSHYAWIDPDHGVVRLPIARALELAAQNGLPKFKMTEQKKGGDKPKETR